MQAAPVPGSDGGDGNRVSPSGEVFLHASSPAPDFILFWMISFRFTGFL
jgi:hypothetical protein